MMYLLVVCLWWFRKVYVYGILFSIAWYTSALSTLTLTFTSIGSLSNLHVCMRASFCSYIGIGIVSIASSSVCVYVLYNFQFPPSRITIVWMLCRCIVPIGTHEDGIFQMNAKASTFFAPSSTVKIFGNLQLGATRGKE